MENQQSEKDAVIKRLLKNQEIMLSKDISAIKEYISMVSGGDQNAINQINAMSDADITMVANTMFAKPVTLEQLQNPETVFDIKQNEAVITIKDGAETNTFTLTKFNGQW